MYVRSFQFAAEKQVPYNAFMLLYVFIVAFLLFGYIWLREIVLRREKARFARRRQWRLWLLDELTKEPPDDDESAV